MGKQLRPRLRDVGEALLEHPRDTSMQLLALGLEERLVRRVLDQRVLERVDGLGRRAAAEDQLGADQLVEGVAQFVGGHRRDRGEYLVAELAADHGADLRHLLDRREAVEARHQESCKVVGIASGGSGPDSS